MATYSLGTSVKINAAVSINVARNNGINAFSWVEYTVPPDCYAVLNVYAYSIQTGSGVPNGEGNLVLGNFSNTIYASPFKLTNPPTVFDGKSLFYLSAGMTIVTYQISNQWTQYVQINGVELKNSP